MTMKTAVAYDCHAAIDRERGIAILTMSARDAALLLSILAISVGDELTNLYKAMSVGFDYYSDGATLSEIEELGESYGFVPASIDDGDLIVPGVPE